MNDRGSYVIGVSLRFVAHSQFAKSTTTTMTTTTRRMVVMAMMAMCMLMLMLMLSTHAAVAAPASTAASMISYHDVRGAPYTIDYDGRSFFVNGSRVLFQSGSIHYPRSTPSMWPGILNLTREANLNMIQIYFFWNYHEISKGVYDWETENRNLGLFLQYAAENNLFVFLRIGPFVCAEWTYGGIPIRLRQEKGIVFRYYEPQWMDEMQTVMTAVLAYVEPYLARNGGPIVLAQIENEYAHVAKSIGPLSDSYVQWCVNLTQTPAFNVGVQWVMCSQPGLVDTVINSFNGFYGDSFAVSHAQDYPNQPAMWTEQYPGWFQHWGEAKPHRPVEDLAYANLLFIAKGGSHYNYYMWHGGTSYGRWAGNSDGNGEGDTTSYGYDAPIAEAGYVNPDKYPHLSAMHGWLQHYAMAIVSNPRALGNATSSSAVTAYVYGEVGAEGTVIFLANTGVTNLTVTFLSTQYYVPAWSVSIVDGVTLSTVFNSAIKNESTTSAASTTTYVWQQVWSAEQPDATLFSYPETVGFWNTSIVAGKGPLEQLDLTLDTTDYLIYNTSITLSAEQVARGYVTLSLTLAYDFFYIYIDQTLVNVSGPADKTAVDTVLNVSSFAAGTHDLVIYSQALGLRNSGAHQEKVVAGLTGEVLLDGVDLRQQTWYHQVDLQGIAEEYYSPNSSIAWQLSKGGTPWTWYLLEIPSPPPGSTFVFDFSSMGKGYIWMNGHMVGRYWNIEATLSTCTEVCDYVGTFSGDKCRYDCGQPSQSFYFIPPDWWLDYNLGLMNHLVFFEEHDGANPTAIRLLERMPVDQIDKTLPHYTDITRQYRYVSPMVQQQQEVVVASM